VRRAGGLSRSPEGTGPRGQAFLRRGVRAVAAAPEGGAAVVICGETPAAAALSDGGSAVSEKGSDGDLT